MDNLSCIREYRATGEYRMEGRSLAAAECLGLNQGRNRARPFILFSMAQPEDIPSFSGAICMSETHTISAASAGAFTIGGDLTVNRLGYGAMRITGPGIWGPPADKAASLATLRRAVELGINLIDTADSYGPGVSERLIAEALYPYPAGLVIATKAGFQRPGPDRWVVDARPSHLREACDASLQRLRLDRIDLYQLHRIDRKVPLEDQIGTLVQLQQEGKIRHIGLSEVTVEEIEAVRKLAAVVSVQNRY